MNIREKVFSEIEKYINNGGVLKRGNPKMCLLGAIGRNQRGDYFKASTEVLGISNAEAGALEAGFEDWHGVAKEAYPEFWQIGADVAAKWLKQ